jgi:glucose/arabinose dehydrogenase
MPYRTLSAGARRLRRPLFWLAAAALLVVLPAGAADAAPPQIPGVELIEAWPDVEFKEPIHVTHGGDGSDYLYVCEQPGIVKRIKKYRGVGAVPQPSVFLDMRSKCYARSQGGLLSMACHPQFKSNRLFYLCYLAENPTPGPEGRKFKMVVAEWRSTGAKADPASFRTVIEIPKKTAQHQAGCIAFGPDGMLYIGIGDGNESKNDEQKLAQNARLFLGKILRIDPTGRQGGKGYSIPKGNPWPSSANVRPEIWGFGFRNPWRFCWDGAGRMWVTEPGSSGPASREWVLQVMYGRNHGWPYLEGTNVVIKPPPGRNIVPRTFEYVRGTGSATAGVGGYVYRGDRVKALKGRYFLGDYMRGEVYALTIVKEGDRLVGRSFGKIGDVPDLASFGEDEQGELYMCSNGDLGIIFTMAPKR